MSSGCRWELAFHGRCEARDDESGFRRATGDNHPARAVLWPEYGPAIVVDKDGPAIWMDGEDIGWNGVPVPVGAGRWIYGGGIEALVVGHAAFGDDAGLDSGAFVEQSLIGWCVGLNDRAEACEQEAERGGPWGECDVKVAGGERGGGLGSPECLPQGGRQLFDLVIMRHRGGVLWLCCWGLPEGERA